MMKSKNKTSFFIKILRVLVIVFFLFLCLENFVLNYYLRFNGTCTYAKVVNIGSVGRQGARSLKYVFFVEGLSYFGHSSGDLDASIGDTIIIVYSNKNPKINRSNDLVEKENNCGNGNALSK